MTRKHLVLGIVLGIAVMGACKKDKSPGPAPTSTAPTASATAPLRIDIVVTENGFEPDRLSVEKGKNGAARRLARVVHEHAPDVHHDHTH